ncbi:MAG: hypothetical protein QNJ97_10855 [Myxococcota bacterium]|nr:hypothetical protein [Myxococcota bacterium]
MIGRNMGSAVFAMVLIAAPAFAVRAQTREDWRATEDKQGPSPKVLNQSYSGVVPGGGNTLPRVEALKGRDGTWITWPGFLKRPGGGSRIFLQTTGAINYKVKQKDRLITLHLKDARVYLSNNRNPLVMTHFKTQVSRAFLKKRGTRVELIIELKEKALPEISQTTDADGYHYLFVDFPSQTP